MVDESVPAGVRVPPRIKVECGLLDPGIAPSTTEGPATRNETRTALTGLDIAHLSEPAHRPTSSVSMGPVRDGPHEVRELPHGFRA
jgi:hypothetical protein